MEYKKFPLTPDGEIDKEAVYQLFRKSRFIRWKLFCEEHGFDPDQQRTFPVHQWIREKRFDAAQETANHLQEMLDEAKPKISEDIIRTLRDYPKAHDDLLKILENTRIALNNEMAEYVVSCQKAKQQNRSMPILRDGFVKDITNLTSALTQLTSSKHRSLLLTNVTFQMFQEKVQQESNFQIDEEKPTANPLTFEIMGFENAGAKDLEELFHRYIDPPQRKEQVDEPS
jgi:hypothetical protein